MKKQAALPFKNGAIFDFEHFLGNDNVKSTLQNFQELPSFTYVCGDQYAGKTHLLVAFGQSLKELGQRFLQLSKDQLRHADLISVLPAELGFILIDDVSGLAAIDDGELALFNFFNHCKSNQIKLVVSGRNHPKDVSWKLPDLISRLNSGLILNLAVLKGDLAFDCLQNQFQFNGIPVDDSVLQFLKIRFSNSYPKLYTLFLKIAAESLQQKRKVTVPLVKSLMAELNNEVSLV